MSKMDIKIYDWRKRGIKIGDNCHIYSSLPCGRDCFLLEISNNVTISKNVMLLLHDSSIDFPSKHRFTDLLGKIIIGEGSFLGANSIVLPGVEIASGTIVAAGSVVTKSIKKPNMIVGGNPAKYIDSVENFVSKNKSKGFNLDNKSKQEIIDDIKTSSLDKLISRDPLKS